MQMPQSTASTYYCFKSVLSPCTTCLFLRLCLSEISNPGSTHFWSRTEFQSTNGHGLCQSGISLIRVESGLEPTCRKHFYINYEVMCSSLQLVYPYMLHQYTCVYRVQPAASSGLHSAVPHPHSLVRTAPRPGGLRLSEGAGFPQGDGRRETCSVHQIPRVSAIFYICTTVYGTP